MTDRCKTCGQSMPTKPKIADCNLCGLPCGTVDTGDGGHDVHMGLIRQRVIGGYHSTPGNGDGALDDLDRYEFSLCEFCLDWLFQRMKISPVVCEVFVDGSAGAPVTYRPAEQRVREDDWRRQKERFFAEFEKRNAARKL